MRSLLCLLAQAYFIVLIAHVIFSWVPRPPDPILPLVRGARALVEPLAAPLRRIIPPARFGGVGFDLSIIVLFIGASIVRAAVCG